MDEYAFEFNQLSKIAIARVPTERERVQRFVKGLRMVIQRFVLLQTFATLREAIAAAKRLERVTGGGESGSSTRGSSQGSNSNTPLRKQDFKQRRTDNRKRPYNRPQPAPSQGSRNPNVVCYECGKKGHTKNQCRTRTGGCFGCGSLTHLVSQCPHSKQGALPAPSQRQALPAPPAGRGAPDNR